MNAPAVTGIFDPKTNTISYLVVDEKTKHGAIIDSVLGYDAASGRTDTIRADEMIALVEKEGVSVEWILETHIHADHLSAAPYLKGRLGGKIAMGRHINEVGRVFNELFNTDGASPAFDHLFEDGELFSLGNLAAKALHTPGHTPACMTYLVGDAAFVGDTLFMPDFGTARTDFPGGDAKTLYHSIKRILALPPSTRLFTGHDYKAPGRDDFRWETTVAEQRANNVHISDEKTEEDFVHLRQTRDAQLSVPALMIPSVQVNIRAGTLPDPEANGRRYIKIPIDSL